MTVIVDKMLHHVGRTLYFRCEAEHIYTGLGHTPLHSVFMFELGGGAVKQKVPGFKWVTNGHLDRVCVAPELKEDVVHLLQLYQSPRI